MSTRARRWRPLQLRISCSHDQFGKRMTLRLSTAGKRSCSRSTTPNARRSARSRRPRCSDAQASARGGGPPASSCSASTQPQGDPDSGCPSPTRSRTGSHAPGGSAPARSRNSRACGRRTTSRRTFAMGSIAHTPALTVIDPQGREVASSTSPSSPTARVPQLAQVAGAGASRRCCRAIPTLPSRLSYAAGARDSYGPPARRRCHGRRAWNGPNSGRAAARLYALLRHVGAGGAADLRGDLEALNAYSADAANGAAAAHRHR